MNPLPHPIGQKVVCINDHFVPAVFEEFDQIPREGQVYTISHLFWGREHGTGEWMLSVRLTEIPPLQAGWGGFSLWRFRLLEDIKILRRREREIAEYEVQTTPGSPDETP